MAKVGDQLLQPESGWKRIDDNYEHIKYTEFNYGTHPSCYGNTYHQCAIYGSNISNANNKIQFNFYGSKIRIIGLRNSAYSNNVEIDIDGVKENFSCSGNELYECLLYEKNELSKKEHIVTIVAKHIPQLGYLVDAVDIDYDGHICAPNCILPHSFPHLLKDKETNFLYSKNGDTLKLLSDDTTTELLYDKGFAIEDVNIPYSKISSEGKDITIDTGYCKEYKIPSNFEGVEF